MSTRKNESTGDETISLLQQMLRLGQIEQALTLIQSFLSEEDVEIEERLKIIKIGCEILLLRGMVRESQEIATKSLEKARKIGNPLFYIDFNLVLVESLLLNHSAMEAQSMLDAAWEELKRIEGDFPSEELLERECLIELYEGDVHFSEELIEESLGFYKKAMKISMNLKNPALIAKTLLRVGRVHAERQEHEQAFHYLTQCLVLLEDHGSPLDLIECLEQLAIVQANRGQFEQALKYHQDRLSLLADTGNARELAKSLAEVSWLSQQVGDLDAALRYGLQSLEMYDHLKDQRNVAYSHVDLAEILRKKGEWQEALSHAHHAMAIFAELKDTRELVRANLFIARIYRQKGDLSRALDQYEQILDLLQDLPSSEELLLEALYWIIMIYLTLNELDQARKYYHRVKLIATFRHAPELPADLVKELVNLVLHQESSKNGAPLRDVRKQMVALLKTEPVSTTYILRVYIHLCELTLNENLLANGHLPDKIRDLPSILEKIVDMYLMLNEHLLAIEFMMLQAQVLSSLEQQKERVLELLNEAIYLTSKYGLNKIIPRLTLITDEIMDNLWAQGNDAPTDDEAKGDGQKTVMNRLSKVKYRLKELKFEMVESEEFSLPSGSHEKLLFVGGTSGFPLFTETMGSEDFDELRAISRKISSYISMNADKIRSSGRNLDLGIIKGNKYVIRFEEGLAFALVFQGSMYFSWRKIEDIIMLMKSQKELWSNLKKKAKEGIFLTKEEKKVITTLIKRADV